MQLSDDEKRCLDGAYGRLKQVAMENIVRYAVILGADELCEVTKATVFCGAHNYMKVSQSEDIDEVFSHLNLARDETIPFAETYNRCYVQSCVAPCDQYQYEPFGQSESFFQKNAQYLEQAKAAGVSIAGTCSPYLTGWIPIQGEHFVTTESGVTVLGNSIWGRWATPMVSRPLSGRPFAAGHRSGVTTSRQIVLVRILLKSNLQ